MWKARIKDLVKKSRAQIAVKEPSSAQSVAQAIAAIDKAVRKGILHRNTGARKKSRLMKRLNALTGNSAQR